MKMKKMRNVRKEAMKLRDNKYALALRDFVFDRITDKEARRELCGLIAGEYCNDDTLLDLLPRYCDAMCDGLDRGSEAYIECFKKSFREVIEDFWQKCDEVPFIPYPDSELWNTVLTDGIAPIKYDDGRCEIWRKTVRKIVSFTPHVIFNKEGVHIKDDKKILDLFTGLFGDEVTAKMFIVYDCWKKTCLAEVVGVMREKLEFYKEKTTEELEKMSDTEVIGSFEQTFGKRHFRYFDLTGNEIGSKIINEYRCFFLIFRDSEYHIFYNHDDEEGIPEDCLAMIEEDIENELCS